MADVPLPFAGLRLSERVSAKARNIRIEVRPDGNVVLVIPRRVAKSAAHAFLRSREDWVRRKVAELREHAARRPINPVLRWDGSDTIPLCGQPTPLRIVAAQIAKPSVRFDDAITLYAPAAQLARPALLANTLRAALRKRARNEAKRLLDEEAERLTLDYSGPRIADQKSLWGSCTPDGLISLNWRLLLAPPEVLRYVVIHELCHRRHLDHSPRFWRLVERQMPDHADWRRWLREHGASLHTVLPTPGRAPLQPDFFEHAL